MNQPISETEREIIASSPIDIYVASNMPYEYPNKLMKPKHASKRIAESAENLIMDSGIGDNISNKGVLDSALEYNCDYVVAKDFLHDASRTTKSIRDFWYQYKKHEFSGTPLIPLQEDHVKHWKELEKPDSVLIGGIRDFSTQKQINILSNFSDSVPDDTFIHALGVGMSTEFVKWVKQNPNKIDSIDCSTPEQNPINNKISDARLNQNKYITCKGEKSSVMRYRLAQLMAVQLNYLMSSFCDMEIYKENKTGSFFDY